MNVSPSLYWCGGCSDIRLVVPTSICMVLQWRKQLPMWARSSLPGRAPVSRTTSCWQSGEKNCSLSKSSCQWTLCEDWFSYEMDGAICLEDRSSRTRTPTWSSRLSEQGMILFSCARALRGKGKRCAGKVILHFASSPSVSHFCCERLRFLIPFVACVVHFFWAMERWKSPEGKGGRRIGGVTISPS